MTDTEDEWDECEVEFNLGEVECRQGRDIRPGRVFCSPKSSSFPPKNLGEVECEAEKSQAATARERSAHGWRTHIIWTKYSQNGKNKIRTASEKHLHTGGGNISKRWK